MSIQEEINRLTQAKEDIKGALDRLGVVYSGSNLNKLAEALGAMQKVEAIQENGVITIPVGYISEEQTFVVGSEISTGYLVNDDSGNVYFQSVKIVNGEAVTDGDPVKINGVDIPNVGDITPDYPKAGSDAELVTGYIVNNEDGSVYFQQVEVANGEIIPVGEPTEIDDVRITDTGTDDPKYTAGADLVRFYKCASVDTATQEWSGYKAKLIRGSYYFDTQLTEGLRYSSGFTPQVDGIYSEDCLIKVSDVWVASED